MIHAYASLGHYADHIQPILDALPDELDGGMWSPSDRKPWGRTWGPETPRDGLWLVAGYADAVRLRGRPLVHVQHGAAQTYPADPRSAGHGAFGGGDGLDHVRLFISPSEVDADRWRTRYPEAAAVAVGCPKMDAWLGDIRPKTVRGNVTGPVVAVTFHHENAQIQEQGSARTFLRSELPALRDYMASIGGILLGHGHPRNWPNLRDMYRRFGIPCTEDLGDVFDRADVLVVDNSSAAYEFASLGRPIVWVSPPWYRREVEHGMRFWRDTVGLPHVQRPEDLIPQVMRALDDAPADVDHRSIMVRRVYKHTDGHAAERAAQAVVDLLA